MGKKGNSPSKKGIIPLQSLANFSALPLAIPGTRVPIDISKATALADINLLLIKDACSGRLPLQSSLLLTHRLGQGYGWTVTLLPSPPPFQADTFA